MHNISSHISIPVELQIMANLQNPCLLSMQMQMSGLYINDGSEAPLWKIDWYAPVVEVASDGNTGLEWITGPKSLSWEEAKTWATNLSVGGGG